MIIIETRDVPAVSYKLSEAPPDWLYFDYCFVKSKPARIASSFVKGLMAATAMLMISGYSICSHNQFVVCLIASIALAFAINELFEQHLSATRASKLVSAAPQFSLRSVNPAFSAIPVVFLFSMMNVQTLMLAVSNAIEVVGIACGVPFLLYGLIKISEDSSFGKRHVLAGSVSAFGGVAVAVVVNLIAANVIDASIFSATNYFGNAIATIYAPDMVLKFDE
ncbi:MAG: hypothetical protein EKK48_15405 [Candidatus Melainabacteria bacterium]|nr:MAG: hypothetical protein EKK48_15405 [Candidatus Melainabacteria bacterium]